MSDLPFSLRSLTRDLYRGCAEGQVLVKDSTDPSGVAPANNGGGGSGTFEGTADQITVTEDPADTFTFSIPDPFIAPGTIQGTGVGIGTAGEAGFLVMGSGVGIKSPDDAIGVPIVIQAGGGISDAGGNVSLAAGGGATTGGTWNGTAGNGDVQGGVWAGNAGTGPIGGTWSSGAGVGVDGNGGDWVSEAGQGTSVGNRGGNISLRPGLGDSGAVNGNLFLYQLPTADPVLDDAVWNNGNVLVRSGDTLPNLAGVGIGTAGSAGSVKSPAYVVDDGAGSSAELTVSGFDLFPVAPGAFALFNHDGPIVINGQWTFDTGALAVTFQGSDNQTDIGAVADRLRTLYVGTTIEGSGTTALNEFGSLNRTGGTLEIHTTTSGVIDIAAADELSLAGTTIQVLAPMIPSDNQEGLGDDTHRWNAWVDSLDSVTGTFSGDVSASGYTASGTVKGTLQTNENATTGLTAGALAALTNASILITDGSGQVYRVPVII